MNLKPIIFPSTTPVKSSTNNTQNKTEIEELSNKLAPLLYDSQKQNFLKLSQKLEPLLSSDAQKQGFLKLCQKLVIRLNYQNTNNQQIPETTLKDLQNISQNLNENDALTLITLCRTTKSGYFTATTIYPDKLKRVLMDLNLDSSERIILKNEDLRGADLRWTNLNEAQFQESDLSGAKLQRSQLQRSCLYKTNLEGAQLQMSNLENAHLGMAHLEGANLAGANLQMVHIHGAKFNEAIFDTNTKITLKFSKCINNKAKADLDIDFNHITNPSGTILTAIDSIDNQYLYIKINLMKQVIQHLEDKDISSIIKPLRDIFVKYSQDHEINAFISRRLSELIITKQTQKI